MTAERAARVSPPRRRSCLTVPASSDKMMAKALTLAADEIVLDLEDAVAPADKAKARERVAALLALPEWRARTVAVRINALDSGWCADDMAAMAMARHSGLTLVVPKVESAGDVAKIETMLGRAPDTIGLQALIETAAGVANVNAIAAASSRLQSLIIGYADLAASLGRPAQSRASWQTVQDLVLIAARANGLQPIDGPDFRVPADETLRANAEAVRDLGFEGKWAIHPSQIETLNAVFTPDAEEVARARALVARLDGVGATTFAGGMIDEAMRKAALRTLARAGFAE